MLEVKSTEKGFLLPRMTQAKRDLIASPAAGLVIWCTNCGNNGEMQLFNGTAWTNMTGGTAAIPWVCGAGFTDSRDGKTYSTVLIGTQCWMSQNLNVGTRINGSGNQTNNSSIEKYCNGDNESYCTTYGGLYQWDEMMQYVTTEGVKGICPTGWHLPTDAEWTTLTTYVSSQTAYHCNSNSAYIAKSLAGTTNWNTSTNTCAIGNNLAGNNATGFTALPGGCRGPDGYFVNLGDDGYWWSSTEYSASYAWYRNMYSHSASVSRLYDGKSLGFSVRCLKD